MVNLGNLKLLGNSNSGAVANAPPVEGVQVINVGSTALSGSTQSPTLPLIPNYNGLPSAVMHFQLIVTDTTGNTTAPTAAPIENVLKEFSIRSLNKSIPLFDIRGDYLEFSRWQHLKNPNGYYVASPTPSDTVTATTYTATWNFDLYFSIPPQLFPLVPSITLNTTASRATTAYGLTSTMNSLTVTMDYIPHQITGNGTRLVNSTIQDATTGQVQLGPFIDKGVTIVQQAYDFGADTNLNTSNTFNFGIGSNQLLLNAGYQTIINKENTLFPSATHISGFFPLFTTPFYSDPTVAYSANVLSAPSINGNANQLVAYWEETIS